MPPPFYTREKPLVPTPPEYIQFIDLISEVKTKNILEFTHVNRQQVQLFYDWCVVQNCVLLSHACFLQCQCGDVAWFFRGGALATRASQR
jgi:hypothetical protein